MITGKNPLPEELEAALEDVRQVRMTVDKLRQSHPMREALRPLARFGFFMTPFFVLYGIGVQWLVDSSAQQVWGLSKTKFIVTLSVVLMIVAGFTKRATLNNVWRRKGYDPFQVMKRMLVSDGYLRIILAIFPTLAVLCVVFVQMGQAHHIPGLIGLLSGSVYILFPLAVPIAEVTWVGGVVMILGAISFFVFPAYPFYKVAVLFGGLCFGFGMVGFGFPPTTERQDERSD